MANLCVNIDHIATLRQARGGHEPDPVKAVKIVEKAGAVGVTVHLREDRRHIQDRDLFLIRKIIKSKLNLEMSINRDIVNIALKVKPDEATIVPERRKELTTEGGLDVKKNFNKLKNIIKKLKENGIIVSLFINPDIEQIKLAKELNSDYIEIHTGLYAEVNTEKERKIELLKIQKAAYFAHSIGLKINAGHGLNYDNVKEISKIHVIEDLNIGHSIISRSIFVGLYQAIKEMIKLIKK
ncbi:MAG: pyridoxine 5'-phosphate synthase [Candidatus Goldbacteria bacterium]|nr:pyridoxine 5'-phosphate synthase [Candidatus Goldiibacteriota bacterium]